jgi:hypothetical protein
VATNRQTSVGVPARPVTRARPGSTAGTLPVVPGGPREDDRPQPTATPPAPRADTGPAAGPRVRRAVDLGQAPLVLALSSLGVLIVALAYADGRDGRDGAMAAYWIGQVVVFTPVAVRLLARRTIGNAESFLLVMGLAINQYLQKWMYSPDQLRFPDELQHWLATSLIVESGDLFRPNPALPPAVHFPGLAELGAAVVGMTGLSVTAAGLLVAAAAHLLFVAGLYAAVLRASGSAAVAGVACVVYATALHYLFFNSMYLYQTGALPFLIVAVWASQRWRAGGGRSFAAVTVAAVVAATVTHHVTAFALVGTLTLLGLSELVFGGARRSGDRRPGRRSALLMPALSLAIVVAWIGLVATDVIAYLQAPIDQIAQTVAVLMGDRSAEASVSAAVEPWQLAIQAAALLALLVLFLAVARDLIRRRAGDAWQWAALIGAGIFFAGNGVRFLGQSGPEIAARLSTFTYVPMSIVAALALVYATRLRPRRAAAGEQQDGGQAPDRPSRRRRLTRLAASGLALTLLMASARVGGWPPAWSLLPGPYLVSGFERSVDKISVDAANWSRTTLGPGNRVSGDVSAMALAATYGRQDPVREIAPLFYADEWSLADDELLSEVGVAYLFVDARLAEQLPALHMYFENDPLASTRRTPMSPNQLRKFDDVVDADRTYDNGTIRIYRMGVR